MGFSRIAVIAGICVATLVGCSGQAPRASEDNGSSVGSTPSSVAIAAARPAPPPPADPCAGGPAGCRRVGTADIDGDGLPDAIGVAVQDLLVTVRVATANGNYDYRTKIPNGTPPGGPQDVVVGAFPISRPAGSDLVLHTVPGRGNADQFVVVGWRDNGLAAVPFPPTLHGNYPEADVWYFLESHGSLNWVTCSTGGSITLNSQSAPEVEGYPIPGGGLLEANHWTFVGGGWSPAGSENTAKSDFSYNFDAHTQAFQCEDRVLR